MYHTHCHLVIITSTVTINTSGVKITFLIEAETFCQFAKVHLTLPDIDAIFTQFTASGLAHDAGSCSMPHTVYSSLKKIPIICFTSTVHVCSGLLVNASV